MTFVKICGITNLDDALAAVEAGADALGFNFYPKSPRFIDPTEAWEIGQEFPESILRVGVFVDTDEDQVREISQYVELDYLQFHGDETPYYCEQFATPYWKAFRLKDEKTLELMEKYHPDAYLVDADVPGQWGGTGELTNWELAAKTTGLGRIILAGGLDPDNVKAAIAAVRPWGVDVCSGIEEEPGVKDHEKMLALIEKVKGEQ